jgi:ubiquinone/menaquinone biosynthesis C-methylase UbiE
MVPAHDPFRDTEEEFWNYAYTQEGERAVQNRNSYFHHHFRKPLIGLPHGSLVLELGCGNRADALEIAQSGHQVIETDISWQALQYSKKLAEKNGAVQNSHYVLAEAEHLPFGDHVFDGVLIAAALHHLSDPLNGLKEMARVVKPGGYIILGVEPNKWPYLTIYRLLSPLKRYIRRKRQRHVDSIADDQTEGFSKNDLKKLCHLANLRIVEILPVKFFTEIYDSYIRLKNRLTTKNNASSARIVNALTKADIALSRIPLINNLAWHWNVIAKVQ